MGAIEKAQVTRGVTERDFPVTTTESFTIIKGGIIENMEEMTSNAVDSDDDLDWEEVQVPEHQHDLEITLQTHSKPDKSTNKFVVILNRMQDSFSFWPGRKEYRMPSVSCASIVIRFIPSHSSSMLKYAING